MDASHRPGCARRTHPRPRGGRRDERDFFKAGSPHHVRPIEGYRDRFILYGCGNLIDASEGLAIYERLHDDLAVLYFATLAPGSGVLLELAMRR